MPDTSRLESLLASYRNAALALRPSADRLAELARAVEEEADAIGYTGHARLVAAHTLAEQCLLPREDRDRRFSWINNRVKRWKEYA